MSMTKHILFLFFLFHGYTLWAQQPFPLTTPAVIPAPVHSITGQGFFSINRQTVIQVGQALQTEGSLLAGLVNGYTGYALPAAPRANENFIKLQTDSLQVQQPEGYQLTVEAKGITITAHDGAGILHGIQTLHQLWMKKDDSHLLVPVITIVDHPRFSYRGMHLDVSRHFFSVPFIKKFIDLLSLYKLNTFHWHLTDDQGWRIEIKKYPLLQSVAAWRKETMTGHKKELPHRFDGKKYGGYYSQEEIKELVKYAAARHINIIPEIEMPGHAQAPLAAYPQLGCTGGPYQTATFWGVFDEVFCAGKDSVFVFLQEVLDEVMVLFPGQYIHIGGDECPKRRWNACPHCKKRMQQEKLADADALQSYFIKRINDYVRSKGRHIIGWDEILEGGLAPDATVMSWRGIEGAVTAARQQHHVIMTPEDDLYFDHYQSLNLQEPVAAGGYTPLAAVYNYDPFLNKDSPVNAEEENLTPFVKGIQGQLWSEYLPTEEQAYYMLLPRMLALAEVAWSKPGTKDFQHFLKRLPAHQLLLKSSGVTKMGVMDDINFAIEKLEKGKITISLNTWRPEAKIYYTTDGSKPDSNNKEYAKNIELTQNATIKAISLVNGKSIARPFEQSFHIHKATGARIVLPTGAAAPLQPMPATGKSSTAFVHQLPTGTTVAQQQAPDSAASQLHGGSSVTHQNLPSTLNNHPASKLVNGIYGTHRYHEQQWLRLSGTDLETIIDLGSVQPIQRVGANVLNYHWQRMWPPDSMVFAVSTDGEHFTPIATQKNFPVNGINKVRIPVKPTKARYIKVTARNKGIIPAGSYGAGGNSLLMIDELIVE